MILFVVFDDLSLFYLFGLFKIMFCRGLRLLRNELSFRYGHKMPYIEPSKIGIKLIWMQKNRKIDEIFRAFGFWGDLGFLFVHVLGVGGVHDGNGVAVYRVGEPFA